MFEIKPKNERGDEMSLYLDTFVLRNILYTFWLKA